MYLDSKSKLFTYNSACLSFIRVILILLHFQIEALQQSDKFKPSSPKETNFAFDYFFEKIQNEGEDEEEEEEEGVKDRENEQASCSSQKEWRYLNIGH